MGNPYPARRSRPFVRCSNQGEDPRKDFDRQLRNGKGCISLEGKLDCLWVKNQWMAIIGNRVADYLVTSVNLEVLEHDSRWLRALNKLYMHVE